MELNFYFFTTQKMTQLTDSTQPVKIEIEDDNEESVEVKAQPETKSKLTITKTRVCDLTEDEKLQLINDAKQGIEHNNFNVKLFKNGNSQPQRSEIAGNTNNSFFIL